MISNTPKFFLISVVFTILSFPSIGQKYLTQSGTIEFFSETPMENIEAKNNQVSTVIDMEKGEIAFSLLMTAFAFEKALMQEHFNEKYVESEKFPKARFKGSITDFASLTLSDEPQTVEVKGELTMHGVTRPVVVKATLSQDSSGKIKAFSQFDVKPEDYEIKIPSAVRDNIASSIRVTVNALYELRG